MIENMRFRHAAAGLVLCWAAVVGCGSNGQDNENMVVSESSHSDEATSEEEMLMARNELIAVGEKAPDFTATDQNGREIRLGALLENHDVVLIFYPANNTPVCTNQLCAVRDDWSQFQEAGAMVLGINPASVEKHAGFSKKHSFPFPVLSDRDSRIAKAYGTSGMLFNQRSVYVIRKDGTVALSDRGVVSHDRIFNALAQQTAATGVEG